MATGYIPRGDNDFLAWADNFVDYVMTHTAELGLVSADTADVTAGQMQFNSALPAHVTAQQAAQAARQTKDDARDMYEAAIRALVRQLQASPNVDDTERQAMGITVKDTTPTQPAGGIDTRPIGVVDTSQRLRHEIRFTDESTPTSRAKPAGVMGCEIWVKVGAAGEPPAGESELRFLSMDTASPYIAQFDGADGGKTAHYMLRWVSKGGDKGPWSETISATIAA